MYGATMFTLSLPLQQAPRRCYRSSRHESAAALNDEFGKRRWWTRHGSTIPLWNPHRVDDAVKYTWEQGEPMERYVNPNRWQEYAESGL